MHYFHLRVYSGLEVGILNAKRKRNNILTIHYLTITVLEIINCRCGRMHVFKTTVCTDWYFLTNIHHTAEDIYSLSSNSQNPHNKYHSSTSKNLLTNGDDVIYCILSQLHCNTNLKSSPQENLISILHVVQHN